MINFAISSYKKLSKPVLGFASGSSMIEKQNQKLARQFKTKNKKTLNFSVRTLNLQPDIL